MYLFIGGKSLKAEIIAIGTELLMGDTVNTNTAFIAKELLSIGIGVYYQQVIGDNPQRMKEAFNLAASRSDIIITSGGLGPTPDDITKEVLADFLSQELTLDEDQWQQIVHYFQKEDRPISEGDYRQAITFKKGSTFINEVGLAAGLAYTQKRKDQLDQTFIAVPGPPFEMEHMMRENVIDYLIQQYSDLPVIDSLYLNFTGIGESQLTAQISDYLNQQDNPSIAVYAQPMKIGIRLTASGENQAEVDQLNLAVAKEIVEKLSNYFIGYGQAASIEKYVVELLTQQNKKVTTAESITGGLVINSLTTIPGASEVVYGGFVTYQLNAKINLLGIEPSILERFTQYSSECALAMAKGAIVKADTDYALALTGVAGPGPDQDHPAGEVFIALAKRLDKRQVKASGVKEQQIEKISDEFYLEYEVKKYNFENKPRHIVTQLAKNHALNMLKNKLQKSDFFKDN